MIHTINLIDAAVDPENTITRNKAVEIASDAPYAVLTATLIEAIGGTTRVVLAHGGSGGQGHAYTEVYLGDVTSNSTKAILNLLRAKYDCNLLHP